MDQPIHFNKIDKNLSSHQSISIEYIISLFEKPFNDLIFRHIKCIEKILTPIRFS